MHDEDVRSTVRAWSHPRGRKAVALDWTALKEAYERNLTSPHVRATALMSMATVGWSSSKAIPDFEADLNACIGLIQESLPGWWWQVGSCHVTGDGDVGPMINPIRNRTHAVLAPDYGDPRATGLPDIDLHASFNHGFDTSLPPGGLAQACRALLISYCAAREALALIPR